ncbi:MAG: hypothetical protein QOJ26_1816 [Thermoplasmata archaeon]|jgi:hypothetical protein|nr:hypothetical protein [Thermoplasmata archaeon]MEA3166937.1 hypothetical protein [Thermoplasmata archaeon]
MTQRLAPAPVTVQQPAFTFKAAGSHVTVRATDRALGLKELVATMKTEPRLHNCVIEQCAFDGDAFTATLRLEK